MKIFFKSLFLLIAFTSLFSCNKSNENIDSTSENIFQKYPKAEERISLNFLTKSKKLISVMYRANELPSSTGYNLKIPNLVVINQSDEAFEIKQLYIQALNSNNTPIQTNILNQKQLTEFISEENNLLNQKTDDDFFQKKLMMMFGELIAKPPFANFHILNAKEQVVLPLQKCIYFNYLGPEKISKMQFILIIRKKGELEKVILESPLIAFSSKNVYSFPIKGNIFSVNHSQQLSEHRKFQSQEFAFDAMLFTTDNDSHSTSNMSQISDYTGYNNNVYAAADGKVVEIANNFSEAKTQQLLNFQMQNESGKIKDEQQKLAKEIGFLNTIAGNYIIIEHNNKEFSVYWHLVENSIQVKPGDTVKRGQLIGNLGSSGDSQAPHLHFQLMDSQDMLKANGLPVVFDNINLDTFNSSYTEINSMLSSDNLFYYIQ